MRRLSMTLRLWGYRVGSSQSWIEVWLQLQGYKQGYRLTLRDAWHVAGLIYKDRP